MRYEIEAYVRVKVLVECDDSTTVKQLDDAIRDEMSTKMKSLDRIPRESITVSRMRLLGQVPGPPVD